MHKGERWNENGGTVSDHSVFSAISEHMSEQSYRGAHKPWFGLLICTSSSATAVLSAALQAQERRPVETLPSIGLWNMSMKRDCWQWKEYLWGDKQLWQQLFLSFPSFLKWAKCQVEDLLMPASNNCWTGIAGDWAMGFLVRAKIMPGATKWRGFLSLLPSDSWRCCVRNSNCYTLAFFPVPLMAGWITACA